VRTAKRSLGILLPFLVSACGSSPITAPTPAPTPTPTPSPPRPTPQTIVLTGQVIDAITLAPIAGAVVSINGRYATVADNHGSYTVTGLLDAGGNSDFTYVSANNYASDYRYIRSTPHNIRLYRVERITAGESKLVTVAPDDTLCMNNMQDSPGNYLCRSVRVVAPTDGVVTIEAVSTQTGTHPPLEAETIGVQPCCSERLGNPTSLQVKAGTEVVVSVEIPLGSPGSETFTLTTLMTAQ
jgi:hypothetical protein